MDAISTTRPNITKNNTVIYET